MGKLSRIMDAFCRSPILWGLMAGLLFYLPIETGYVTNAAILRYFAGHWVEYIETTMFFVGLAALLVKAMDVRGQLDAVRLPLLPSVPAGGQAVEECPQLLAELDQAATRTKPGYLITRLREALEHVRRKGSAESLDEEIKYLGDMDALRAQHSYAFVRIIIWAIPILGFLGTVIGITLAIANLAPEALEASLPEVTSGLGVAFDTTAIALGFSMLLMFVQYAVDRMETRLLSEVDARTTAELVGRFQVTGASTDPQLAAVRRMLDAVVQSSDRLVARQSELWQSSIEVANQRWTQLSAHSGSHLETALAAALDRSLQAHADRILAVEKTAAEQNRQHWSQVQQARLQSSEAAAAQQRELRKQGEVLLKVVEATRQVADLESVLNRNLTELSAARGFDDMLASLSAAVHLLSARLGQMPAESRHVELNASRRTGQAA